MENFLQIKNLKHSYNSNAEVLKGIDMEVTKGEIISILGPSGCGKTTLLRIIAGLEKQTEGTVSIDNQMTADHLHYIPTEKRNVGLVVQERALFPHLTNIKNVKFGIQGSDKNKTSTALDFLKLFKVEKYADNFPHEISSGEQQRVALARAMAPNPKILLMDEPFGALDIELRFELRQETRKILKDNGITSIIVSHDIDDASAMSDRVLIIKNGIIVQNGSPKEVVSINSNISLKNS
tara:strand:- start:10 stop:720 length:711 start_codon:yes stop_codon:yes gene_type:complete